MQTTKESLILCSSLNTSDIWTTHKIEGTTQLNIIIIIIFPHMSYFENFFFFFWTTKNL